MNEYTESNVHRLSETPRIPNEIELAQICIKILVELQRLPANGGIQIYEYSLPVDKALGTAVDMDMLRKGYISGSGILYKADQLFRVLSSTLQGLGPDHYFGVVIDWVPADGNKSNGRQLYENFWAPIPPSDTINISPTSATP